MHGGATVSFRYSFIHFFLQAEATNWSAVGIITTGCWAETCGARTHELVFYHSIPPCESSQIGCVSGTRDDEFIYSGTQWLQQSPEERHWYSVFSGMGLNSEWVKAQGQIGEGDNTGSGSLQQRGNLKLVFPDARWKHKPQATEWKVRRGMSPLATFCADTVPTLPMGSSFSPAFTYL